MYLLTEEQCRLIYGVASAMQSIAATLTGEAKGELSSLREALESTDALPRSQADALAQGVAAVRENLRNCPSGDPIGDGNRLWDVFTAVWGQRAPYRAPPSPELLKLADDLGYVLECVAEGFFGDANLALSSLCRNLECYPPIQFAGRVEVVAAIRYADSCLASYDLRREGTQVLCKAHRKVCELLSEGAGS